MTTNRTYIITGGVHQGKTTFARQLAMQLSSDGLKVDGFVCPGTFESDVRDSFSILFLSSNQELPFVINQHKENWICYKRFCFNPEVLNKGNSVLINAANDESTAVFVDEIGKWEIEDGGWSEGVNALLQKQNSMKILVIRKEFVKAACEKFNMENPIIFDIQNVSLQEAYEGITTNLTIRNLLL